MYTREILTTPKEIIINGVPQFGTYKTPPTRLDIRNLKQPFNIMPLPRFLTNTRIRGNIEFFFNTEQCTGTIDILDAGFFCFAETNIWEKHNGRKLSYRCLLPLKRMITQNLDKGICVTFRKKRYFRMKWNHMDKSFSFVFNYEGDTSRPSASGAFTATKDEKKTWGMLSSILPFPLKNRCTAIHTSVFPLNGSISSTSQAKTELHKDSTGQGLFSLRWAFYKLRNKYSTITGFATIEGKDLVFKLSQSSVEPLNKDLYNENVLFIDGKETTLPPVIVTRPKGTLGPWIVQDTESMVDLSFQAQSDTKRTQSILILRTEYHTMYGRCEGALLDAEGNKYTLKNCTAIAKKHSLRL